MIHDPDIILITKPSIVDNSLNDGVAVWIMTSSRFLIMKSGSLIENSDHDDKPEQDK